MKKPQLPPDTDTHYFYLEPVYDRYRDVTVIDRCECCDHKIGSHKEKRGVKIIKYNIKKGKKDMWWHTNKLMQKHMIDRLFTPNPLVEKAKKEKES